MMPVVAHCRMLAAAVALPLVVPAAVAQVRPITVTISAAAADGSPLEAVPLQCVTKNGVAFGLTDQNGQLVVTLDADERETVMASRLWTGMWHELPVDQRALAEERYEQLRHAHSFESIYRVPLEPQTDNYVLRMTAGTAIRLRGRLVNGQGEPVEGTLGIRKQLAFDTVDGADLGVFDFGGVREGAPAVLFAEQKGSAQVRIVELTAQQTRSDADLGDIVLTEAPADALVNVTMVNQQDLFDDSLMSLGLGVSFVSTDGALALSVPADLDGHAVRERLYTPSRRPVLPPGEYYVAPGSFAASGAMALYLSVRAGRQAALDAAGVPKITAVSGQEASLEFDARAAYDAIIQVGGDLVD